MERFSDSDVSPARLYARVVGPTVVLVGLLGLALGNDPLGEVLNIDLAEDLIHLASGGLLIYLGFGPASDGLVRTLVGVVGATYLAVGLLSFFVPDMFGLIPHEYRGLDNAIHLALGALGVAAAVASARAEARV